MPIFDYKCKKCGKDFEILHKGREIIEDIECPACGSRKYLKLFSVPSVHTKEIHPCGHSDCGVNGPCCGGEACGMI
jgi:putative FmdB family regulatory protein